MIELADVQEARALFGSGDRNLKRLKRECSVDLVARNGTLKIRGDEEQVKQAVQVVESLRDVIRHGRPVTPETVTRHVRGEALPADEVEVGRIARDLLASGVEARHLRGWKTSAEREVALFEQLVAARARLRNPEARREMGERLSELEHLGGRLRSAMVSAAMRSRL